MKIIKKILLSSLLLFVTIGAVACGGLKMPSSTDQITGNGGTSVMKGNYLYTTNGYLTRDTITMSNRKKSDYVNSGLYVIELNSDGSIKTDSEGDVSYVKRLSGYITGFEHTSLHIFGNYLYYTTPSRGKTAGDSPVVTKTLMEFWRVKLDGTDNTKIFAASAEAASVSFDYHMVDRNVVLSVLDGTDLHLVTCGSSIRSDKISADVTSLTTHTELDNPTNNESLYTNVYYAANLSEEDRKSVDRGNKMYRLNLKTKKSTLVAMDNNTYTVDSVKDGNLYTYRSATSSMAGTLSANYLYRSTLADMADGTPTFVRLTQTSYSSVDVLNTDNVDGMDAVLVTTDSSTALIKNGEYLNPIVILDKKMSILSIRNTYVYYTDADAKVLYRMDINSTSGSYTAETIYEGNYTAKLSSGMVDVDGRYVYMYFTEKNDNSTIYTYRLDTEKMDEFSKYVTQFVGEYAKDDAPKTEEAENK